MLLHPKLNRKGKLIQAISTYRTWYDKGIQVMSVIRNMEFSDLAILMAVTKYMFGDFVPTWAIVAGGMGYWVFNAILNCSVGWFWEKNDGWRIEAEVFGKRNAVSRTVLVSPEGDSYDARDLKVSGPVHDLMNYQQEGSDCRYKANFRVSSDWPDDTEDKKAKKHKETDQ